MQNFIKIMRFLVYLHISRCFRHKKVYVICGMRRSGNHACINWLLNGLEDSESGFKAIVGDRMSVSYTQKTVFFNEANFYGLQHFWRLVIESKGAIQSANNVIISLEDYTQNGKFDPFFPRCEKRILIKRSMLNLIASRLQRAVNQAKDGKDRGDMAINELFFKRVKWIESKGGAPGWLTWSFDDWLLDAGTHRADFLHQLGLSFNQTPKMSTQGGGSSFTGQSVIPSSTEMQSRWNKVNWPSRVIGLLRQNKSLLGPEEREFLENKSS